MKSSHRLLLVAPMVACILLTSVLAFLVLSSSVKSEPSPPYVPQPDLPSCYDQQNMSQRQINACVANEQAVWAQYQQAVKAAEFQSGYFGQFAVYNSYLSNIPKLWMVATGAVTVLLFSLSARFPRSRPVKALAVLALIGGLVIFMLWAFVDFCPAQAQVLDLYPNQGIGKLLNGGLLFGNDTVKHLDGMGFSAFSSFCVAVAGFVALRVKKGIVWAVVDGLTLFAAPILVVFELGLWHYIPQYFGVQVTDFTPWLTNSDVLAVALCFIIAGCVPFLAAKEVAREERMLAGFGP